MEFLGVEWRGNEQNPASSQSRVTPVNAINQTIKNDKVEVYDKKYQYIVNLFGQKNFGMDVQQTDLKAMKMAMVDIREKAESIGATVAMPYMIGSYRGGAKWEDVYKIIQDVFNKSTVDVEICKYDRG